MNEFAIGTQAVPGGHIAWFRKVHRAENEIVRGDRGQPIIFPTKSEAKAAAGDALVAYMNGSFCRSGEIIPSARLEAEKLFKETAA